MTETFLQMAERHRDIDMLAQGDFDFTGTACSVGCFNHDLEQTPGDFAALAEFSGYPEWAHRLQEAVFEGLPIDQARDWHVRFAEAAERVTDWTAHYHKVMISILEIALPHDPSGVVQQVIDLHKRGPEVTKEEWAAAQAAAWAAKRAAARDAAWAAAWEAAEAAEAAAVEAAEAAARAAEWKAEWDVADAERAAALAAAWAKIADAFCDV